jgi:hypothetical protein
MIFNPKNPPREYRVGKDAAITIRDCARIELADDEQITLTTRSGTEFDVLRKDWGYYTPSLNGRFPEFGLRPALVRSSQGRYYMVLVEEAKRQVFLDYIAFEKLEVVAWMDSGPDLERFRKPAE